MEYLLVGLGGTFGALLRYTLNKWVNLRWKRAFPLATFIINISGSFALGFFLASLENFRSFPPHIEVLLTSGFLGAFTTYSTFSLETIQLIQGGNGKIAVKYVALSLLLGLASAWAGLFTGGLLHQF